MNYSTLFLLFLLNLNINAQCDPGYTFNENIFGPADRFNRGKILFEQITLLEKILDVFKFKNRKK